mgnify:CR=1 FL=1
MRNSAINACTCYLDLTFIFTKFEPVLDLHASDLGVVLAARTG